MFPAGIAWKSFKVFVHLLILQAIPHTTQRSCHWILSTPFGQLAEARRDSSATHAVNTISHLCMKPFQLNQHDLFSVQPVTASASLNACFRSSLISLLLFKRSHLITCNHEIKIEIAHGLKLRQPLSLRVFYPALGVQPQKLQIQAHSFSCHEIELNVSGNTRNIFVLKFLFLKHISHLVILVTLHISYADWIQSNYLDQFQMCIHTQCNMSNRNAFGWIAFVCLRW